MKQLPNTEIKRYRYILYDRAPVAYTTFRHSKLKFNVKAGELMTLAARLPDTITNRSLLPACPLKVTKLGELELSLKDTSRLYL